MKRTLFCLLSMSASAFLCFIETSLAQAVSNEPASVVFTRVKADAVSKAIPFIVDGTEPADGDDWQATLFTKDSGINCSATIIAPRVVLTAAHCLARGTVIGFTINQDVLADCTISPNYPKDKSSDYALCLTRTPVIGIIYERLAVDPASLSRSNSLILAGYGCARYPAPVYLGFRVGKSSIWKLPGEVDHLPNFIQTQGGSTLCLGDSGGGAYIIKQPSRSRRLVAINAVMNADASEVAISSFASVTTLDFRCFASQWLKINFGRATVPGWPGALQCTTG